MCHELGLAAVVMGNHCGVRDSGGGEERGVDLTELDALTSNLDLIVASTQILEAAVPTPGRNVPCTVEPLILGQAKVLSRHRKEGRGGGLWLARIPVGQLHSTEVEFPWEPYGNRTLPGIEHVALGVPYRISDGDNVPVTIRVGVPVGDIDRCLCGSVEVDRVYAEYGPGAVDEI
jgi:hypothetical protein